MVQYCRISMDIKLPFQTFEVCNDSSRKLQIRSCEALVAMNWRMRPIPTKMCMCQHSSIISFRHRDPNEGFRARICSFTAGAAMMLFHVLPVWKNRTSIQILGDETQRWIRAAPNEISRHLAQIKEHLSAINRPECQQIFSLSHIRFFPCAFKIITLELWYIWMSVQRWSFEQILLWRLSVVIVDLLSDSKRYLL